MSLVRAFFNNMTLPRWYIVGLLVGLIVGVIVASFFALVMAFPIAKSPYPPLPMWCYIVTMLTFAVLGGVYAVVNEIKERKKKRQEAID